jgi:hypothetical protein
MKYLTQRRRDAECAEEMEVIFCCFSERDAEVYDLLINNEWRA